MAEQERWYYDAPIGTIRNTSTGKTVAFLTYNTEEENKRIGGLVAAAPAMQEVLSELRPIIADLDAFTVHPELLAAIDAALSLSGKPHGTRQ